MYAFAENGNWTGWQGKILVRFFLHRPDSIFFLALCFGETAVEGKDTAGSILILDNYCIHVVYYPTYTYLSVVALEGAENSVFPSSFTESFDQLGREYVETGVKSVGNRAIGESL